jgi:hypothetical protein
MTQVENPASPREPARCCHAWISVSWRTSRASSRSPVMRGATAYRRSWRRRTRTANACSWPVRARSTQRTSGASADPSASLLERRGRRLTLALDLAEYADIAEVRQTIEDRVVARARRTLDDPDLPVDVELRPGRTRSAGHGVR